VGRDRTGRLTLPPAFEQRARRFDDVVDRGFEHLRGNPGADKFFYVASALGDHSLVWHILGAVQGLRSERHFKAAVRLSATLGVESVLVNVGVKSLFRRTRPLHELPRPFGLRRPRTSSFPSGHATSAFCAAVLLADGDPLGPAWYVLATAVAASRIHVRIHHATDVVGGVVVGLAIGHAVKRLVPLDRTPGDPAGSPRS
jgi:undecaprenyl-diphosphatase